MLIKSLVTGAAFALAISVGSASAAEDFATTSNVPAEPLTASEMAAVVGAYLPKTDFTGRALSAIDLNGALQTVCIARERGE